MKKTYAIAVGLITALFLIVIIAAVIILRGAHPAVPKANTPNFVQTKTNPPSPTYIPPSPTPLPEVAVSFDLKNEVLSKQAPTSIYIVLTNTATTERKINVAGVDIEFNDTAGKVTNLLCGKTLPISAVKRAEKGKIALSCFVGGGETSISLPSNIPVTLGSFAFALLPTSSSSTLTFRVTRVKIPDATSGADLAIPPKDILIPVNKSRVSH